MNKREFLSTLAKAAVGFSILPSVLTYQRRWKKTEMLWIPNPIYVDAERQIMFIAHKDFAIFWQNYVYLQTID
jgi:hypothetical protein